MPELICEERDGLFYAALIHGKTMIDLAVDIVGDMPLYQSIWRVKIDRIVPHVGAFANFGTHSGLFHNTDHKSGDSVIAQIKSRRSEGKADILTEDVSLGGKYFVYLPRGAKIRISRKIDAIAAAPIIAALAETGIQSGIVREAALRAPLSHVTEEAMRLQTEWQALEKKPDDLLRAGPDAAQRLIQDYPQHDLMPLQDSFEARGFSEQLAALHHPQIKLPSGGSIVIERTAALTAIDVNAGTVAPATADREALTLIATQIRLRNLSGLIVIDFTAKDKPDALLEQVRRAASSDPAGMRVAGTSPSGLIELIRPARDLPLAEKFAKIGA